VWKYEIGDKLICEREENNPNDKFSVKLVLQRGNPGQYTCVKFYCLFHEVNLEIFSLINAPLLENVNAPGAFIRRNTV
jgi:hypothetical protein